MWRHHDLIPVPDLTGILRRDYLIVPRPWTDTTPFDIPNMKDASWQGYHSYNYVGIGLSVCLRRNRVRGSQVVVERPTT
jgi:hypothetical protein